MTRIAPVYRLACAVILAAYWGHVLPMRALWLLCAAAPLLFWRSTRVFAAFALLVALMLVRQAPPVLPQDTCTFTATIRDFAYPILPCGQRLTARAEASDDCPALAGRPLVLLDYEQRDFPLASRWQMRGTVRADGDVLAIVKTAQPLSVSANPLLRLRLHLDERIRAHIAAPLAPWLQALLIGNRSALQEADRHLLRTTGTSHLLAISGLHVALVALMAFGISKTLWALPYRLPRRIAPRDAAMVAMLAITWGYVLLSGAQAPALRAWLMLLGVSLHWFVPRVRSGMQGLALAAGVSVLFDPQMLWALGAWLSYLATVIVLLAWQRYREMPALVQWPLLQGWITLALTPLSWAWFGGVSVVGFFANLVVVPWLGVLLGLGFLACAHAAFAPLAEGVLQHTLATLRFFANLPFAYREWFWQPATATALVAYAVIAAQLARRQRFTLALLPVLLAAIAWQSFPKTALYRSPNGHAALLHTRDASVVINPGYRYRERDDAKRYVLPELRRRGRSPAFILITADKKNAHSALKTLLDAYPHTPVYSLVPLKDFPFAVDVCPAPPLTDDCALEMAGYRIDATGIHSPNAP